MSDMHVEEAFIGFKCLSVENLYDLTYPKQIRKFPNWHLYKCQKL